MSPTDDFTGEVLGLPFEDNTANSLLEGRVLPDDAPPGFQELAAIVLVARAPSAKGDLVGEDVVVPAFLASIRTTNGVGEGHDPAGRRILGGSLVAKVAVAAVVLTLAGTSAAAATGSLPPSIQSAVSHDLAHLGISVPNPSPTPPHSSSAASSSHVGSRTGAPTTTANNYGLCTAYLGGEGNAGTTSKGKALDSTAMTRLRAEAEGAGETITLFCATVTKPESPTANGASGTPASGSSDSTTTTTTGSNSPATSTTNPASNAPVTTTTNPVGKTPGPPPTNPAGKTPGAGQPATNPAGKTPGAGSTSNNGNGNGNANSSSNNGNGDSSADKGNSASSNGHSSTTSTTSS